MNLSNLLKVIYLPLKDADNTTVLASNKLCLEELYLLDVYMMICPHLHCLSLRIPLWQTNLLLYIFGIGGRGTLQVISKLLYVQLR